MSGLIPYLLFPGNAAEALRHYQSVFGGDLQLLDYATAGRHDGPGDAIAHGQLSGLVELAVRMPGPTTTPCRWAVCSSRSSARPTR